MNLVVLIGLLVLPAIAGQRSGVNLLWIGTYAILISGFTYWIYARDKRRAEAGEWRVPEMRLHLLELLGGWPAAFLAQRRLRHKCSKGSYQFVFWLIVLVWQLAAVDSLQDWKLSRSVWNWLEHTSENRR